MVDDGEPADLLLEKGPIIDPENLLTVRSIKMYADGALGSRGAALIEKYSDYDGKGVFIFREEETKPRLAKALIKGIQIATHAIGDNGNRVVLNWYEEAFENAKSKVLQPQRERFWGRKVASQTMGIWVASSKILTSQGRRFFNRNVKDFGIAATQAGPWGCGSQSRRF